MFTSIRSRLIAIYLGIIVIGFGGLTWWAASQLSQTTLDDSAQKLQVQALSLAAELHEPMEDRPDRIGGAVTSRIQSPTVEAAVFNLSNNLVYTTFDFELSLSENLNASNVVLSDGQEYIVATAEILDDDEKLGVVLLAELRSETDEIIRERILGLIIGFIAFSILGLAATLWLLTTVTRPLSNLRDSALAMAAGNLNTRIDQLSNDEVGAVGTAFNTMAEQVEAMVQEQRAFASNASHELRTPITTIQLRTEALLDHQLPEEFATKYVTEIDSEAKRMGKLVEDLLMLSRLDANRLDGVQEQIDAKRMLNLLLRELSPKFESKDIQLEEKILAKPLIISMNRSHLRVVFRNILDNAIKYTPLNGRIEVSLNEDDGFVILQVVDNGRGIAPEDLPQIGKRFFRADKSRSREVQGTGLGLAMVYSILELYQGELEISSSGVDQGTAVTLRLPLDSQG